jgi:hypothetical protein
MVEIKKIVPNKYKMQSKKRANLRGLQTLFFHDIILYFLDGSRINQTTDLKYQ